MPGDVLVCASGACPRGPEPKDATLIERMARKLLTKPGATAYAARKGIVELGRRS